MANKKYRKGVQALVIDSENNFLIVQLNAYKENEWNFIGGGREGNETIIENLNREVKEELSLDKDDFEIIGQNPVPLKYDFPPAKENEIRPFEGQIKEQFIIKLTCSKEKIKIQEEEIRVMKWVKFNELEAHLVFPGQFQNAKEFIELVIPAI